MLNGEAHLSAAGETIAIDQVSVSSLGETVVDGEAYSLADLRAGGTLDTTGGDASIAHSVVRAAMSEVAVMRGRLGSFQSDVISGMQASTETAFVQLSAAHSIIVDTDYASEMSNLLRSEILQKTSLMMLLASKDMAENAISMLG